MAETIARLGECGSSFTDVTVVVARGEIERKHPTATDADLRQATNALIDGWNKRNQYGTAFPVKLPELLDAIGVAIKDRQIAAGRRAVPDLPPAQWVPESQHKAWYSFYRALCLTGDYQPQVCKVKADEPYRPANPANRCDNAERAAILNASPQELHRLLKKFGIK
ncbi:MAG: hypothetical protein KHW84_21345 [Enterobacter cloacae]|nr:hypothetical protein [Enterobacter cloacae]OFJ72386.1 hypothetical protein HMPREF2851_05545 [Actinomyces sp. HMSC064C12]OFK03757.1 hypothetical protein HMPREF2835_04935 [Actinomyces sp. HMSC072A03]OFT40079.1 hypothetical protein HMPREF3163_01675 [Actinomyces sp. HMSC08A01]